MEEDNPYTFPLKALVGVIKLKLKWTRVHQMNFEEIKKVMDKDTTLNYQKFNKTFEINTNDSDMQQETGNMVQSSLKMVNLGPYVISIFFIQD